MNSAALSSPFILYLLVTLSPLGIDTHLPALLDIKQFFGVDDYSAQLTVLAFVFSMGVGQLLAGILADRIGNLRAGYIGIALFVSGSLIACLPVDFQFFLVARVMQGLGASALMVIAYATTNQHYHGEQAAVIFSIQSGFLNIIPSVAPIVGALVLSIAGWQSIFAIFVLYGVIVLFGFMKYYTYPSIRSNTAYKTSLLALVTDRAFLLYACVCALALGYIMTYINIAPLMMMEHFAASSTLFSVCFAINASFIALSSFFLKYAIARYGSFRCIVVGMMLMIMSSLGLWIFFHSMSMLLFWTLIGYGSIGFAFLFGPSVSRALAAHQAYSGLASGVLGCIYLSCSPLIASGILSDNGSDTLAFGRFFTVAGVCMLIACLFVGRKSTKNTH